MRAKKEHGINLTTDDIYKLRNIQAQEMEEFVKKLRDEAAYPIKKKLQYLIYYQAEMIEADKNRKENRKCTQEYCRMTGSMSQSYFILDS